MNYTIRTLWRICLLDKSPADLPCSITGMLLCALVYAGVDVLFNHLLHGANWRSLFMLIFVAIFTYTVLMIVNLQTRFVQTFTALLGCNAIVYLFAAPILLAHNIMPKSTDNHFLLLLVSVVLLFYALLIGVWMILMTAHIYAKAVNVGFLAGLLIVFAMMGVDILISVQLQL